MELDGGGGLMQIDHLFSVSKCSKGDLKMIGKGFIESE